MSQVMRTVKIPECMNPFYVEVNGHKYSYPAGTTQEVPEDVAAVIEAHEGNHHHGRSGPVHNQSLNIQADWNVNDPGDLRFIKNKPSGGGNGGGGADLLDGNGIIKQEYLPDDIGNCPIKPFPVDISNIDIKTLENDTFYYLEGKLSYAFLVGGDVTGTNLGATVSEGILYYNKFEYTDYGLYGELIGGDQRIDYSYKPGYRGVMNVHRNHYYLSTDEKVGMHEDYTPVYPNNPATKKYVDDSIAAIPDVEKGNWNQNDPEAADYIKNRTHYVEYGDNLVEILPAASLALNEENGAFMLLDAIELTAGKQYVVKFTDSSNNEVEYTTMCVEAPENGDGMKWMLGDAGLMEGTPTTGEPFIMIVLDPSVVPQIGFGAMVMWVGGTVLQTISISAQEEIVHKLDPKFLPEGVGGGMLVKITRDENDNFTPDKNYGDVINAIKSGSIVQFAMVTTEYPNNLSYLRVHAVSLGEYGWISLTDQFNEEWFVWSSSEFRIDGGEA